MVMYAVLKIQWHQYLVKEGDAITVDRVDSEVGDSITFDEVLLSFGEDQSAVSIWTPHVKGAKVVVKVAEHMKWKKIRVLKFQWKKRYQRVKGHRSYQTLLHIESVSV